MAIEAKVYAEFLTAISDKFSLFFFPIPFVKCYLFLKIVKEGSEINKDYK